MFNEITSESYRIPWLIWIQLIVLFLLFSLIYFITVVDDDTVTVTASIFPETSSTSSKSFLFEEIQQIDKPLITNHDSASSVSVSNNGQHHNFIVQDGENLSIKDETGTCSSMRSVEVVEGESSTLSFHPCHYFQLVTVAFLKCFGLDSTSDIPSNRKRRKRKES